MSRGDANSSRAFFRTSVGAVPNSARRPAGLPGTDDISREPIADKFSYPGEPRAPAPDASAFPKEFVEPVAQLTAVNEIEEPLLSLNERLSRLEATPAEFDFFQIVRAFEAAHPSMPRIGTSSKPADDFLRFGQEASVKFPVGAIESFRPAVESAGKPAGKSAFKGKPARMSVNFLGLLGNDGPMPLQFTEHVRKRRSRGDRATSRFLDLFNHRMVSFFYRAWAQHQRTAGFDRPAQDRFATYIGSLFGIGMPAFRNRDAMPDVSKLAYSGFLSCQTRPAEGLASSIEGFFGVTAAVEEFVGRWINIPAENISRLGVSRQTGCVGQSVLLGSRTWDCQQKFRIHLGPMTFEQFQRLLPNGMSFRRLVDWVRNYADDALSWDVRLTLKSEQVPMARLGMVGQLGWTTWLVSKPEVKNRQDLILIGARD